jgi:hypothetical protein
MLQQLQGTRVLNMKHYSCHIEGIANSCPAEPGQAARVVPLQLQQLQGTRVLKMTHYILMAFKNKLQERIICSKNVFNKKK